MKLPVAVLAVFSFSGPGACGPDRMPVELPPPGYEGEVFTDSEGCVFVRMDVEGRAPIWVQRLDASDRPDCSAQSRSGVVLAAG